MVPPRACSDVAQGAQAGPVGVIIGSHMGIEQSDLLSPWMSPDLHHVHRKTAMATVPVGVLDPFQLFLFLQRYSMHRRQISHLLL